MHLLSKLSSILVGVLSVGLIISFAPSIPKSVLGKSEPQSTAFNDIELLPVTEINLAVAEAPLAENKSSSPKTAIMTSEGPSIQEAIPIAPAFEISSSSISEPVAVFTEGTIAIRGADPVAYFTQGAYVAGSSEYTYDWGGATWKFANAEHRDLFAENPGQYAPQYGGFCAWAVSQGYTAPIDPTAWDIVGGKLYLNFNARIQRQWQQDISGHISRANQNWPSLRYSHNR